MANILAPSNGILKQAIMDLKEPVIFRGILKDEEGCNIWKFLDWNLTELAEKLGDMRLPFRTGFNGRSKEPQWDIKCPTQTMTMQRFLEESYSCDRPEKWYYFDYKYMHEWLKDQPEILASVDWRRFGFDAWGEDSTLWIGNKGAHTNCHQDSYGCNLVAQMHGRKQWFLFPPSCTNALQPTRIPYEESTVYSKFNFFCPTQKDEEAIVNVPERPKCITLEPGQVLFVPGGWWHYVESLDLSVSVNVWLPLPTDCEARLREALVKLIATRLGKGCLNSAEEPHSTLHRSMKLVEACLHEVKANEEPVESPSKKKAKAVTWTAAALSKEYPKHVSLLSELNTKELRKLLIEKRERFSVSNEAASDEKCAQVTEDSNLSESSLDQISKAVINSFCHPDIISRVAQLVIDSNVTA
ncbi:HSPB1-associated protein 1 isoform X2 [Cephus cinctus]|nr:HSPB1-associated protein 1 isoform X2 [Cephus cinctus]